ncbi:MAG: polynucleotide adenylyltransferase PcnB, partial [Planctomycetota bacterium]
MDLDAGPLKYKKTIIFPASLDSDAVKIIRRLCNFGHTSYLVGGCVRDLLLGKIPKDFDISTSARPRQIKRIFKNARIIGRRFRLVHVIFRDKIIEVSTFRKSPDQATDESNSDGLLILRDNTYGDERDDSLRRDFTINGLFYDIKNEEVLDYTNGVKDIQRRIIRTIGDPHIRFQEDPVRILRAIRFSCRLNLEIDPQDFEAMKEYAEEIQKSASQRVTEEIIRLMACGASAKALQMMHPLGLIQILLPEVDKALEHHSPFFDSKDNGWDFLLKLAEGDDDSDRGGY